MTSLQASMYAQLQAEDRLRRDDSVPSNPTRPLVGSPQLPHLRDGGTEPITDEGRRSVVAGGLRELASCGQRVGVCLSGKANGNDADALEDPAKWAPSSSFEPITAIDDPELRAEFMKAHRSWALRYQPHLLEPWLDG